MPWADGGLVKYIATYGKRSTGREGRLFGKNISLHTTPRRIWKITYDGIGVSDWGSGSAYINFAFHAIGEMRIEISHAHCQLSTVGEIYIR